MTAGDASSVFSGPSFQLMQANNIRITSKTVQCSEREVNAIVKYSTELKTLDFVETILAIVDVWCDVLKDVSLALPSSTRSALFLYYLVILYSLLYCSLSCVYHACS